MYSYTRNYYGKLRGCIFDWSGTLIDKYSIAPVRSLIDTFRDFKIDVTGDDVRSAMGIRKDEHIKDILNKEHVKSQWMKLYKVPPTNTNFEELNLHYQMKQLDTISEYTEIIPGVRSQLLYFKNNRRLLFGGTTGFYNNITEKIKEDIRKQGLILDAFVSGDDVKNGSRPNPFMLFRCMELLGISNVRSVLKVDDTIAGVQEGLNAGVWTVGVARYSNYMNIHSLDDLEKIDINDYNERVRYSYQKLLHSGAHYVINDLSELDNVIRDINSRLKRGESP